MSELIFGANRMVAPSWPIEEFVSLAAEVNAAGVELRNDLPGFDVTDDLESAAMKDLLAKYGQNVISINAVQHFNLPSALEDARTELRRLIGFASQLGNPGIVMCPHNDTGDTRSRAQMARDTKAALLALKPILEDAGVVGLVEPLGFPESSLRSHSLAAQIIGEIGSDALRITLDTFHFAVAGQDPAILGTAEIPVGLIGLVHLSGVTAAGPIGAFRDPDRVYVDENDRVGNVASLRRIVSAGYTGAASFEPFSPVVHAYSRSVLVQVLNESVNGIRLGIR